MLQNTLMKYIVHGSKNQNDSKNELALEWNSRNKSNASKGLDHALVTCDLTQILQSKFTMTK